MKREHRVPLCRRALDILDTARTLGGGNPLVFPSIGGKRLHDMALSGLLKRLKVEAVPHGFRSSFRDWAAEETDHPREVVESALAHVVHTQGGLRPLGPVRAAADADGRLGRVPRRRPPDGRPHRDADRIRGAPGRRQPPGRPLTFPGVSGSSPSAETSNPCTVSTITTTSTGSAGCPRRARQRSPETHGRPRHSTRCARPPLRSGPTG